MYKKLLLKVVGGKKGPKVILASFRLLVVATFTAVVDVMDTWPGILLSAKSDLLLWAVTVRVLFFFEETVLLLAQLMSLSYGGGVIESRELRLWVLNFFRPLSNSFLSL